MIVQTFSIDPRPGSRRAVFVDRDGVINVNRPIGVSQWSDFEFLPRALDALALLADHGWWVVVVTNQAQVNRGAVSEADLYDVHERMVRAIRQAGGDVAVVIACPHRPAEECGCRKPAPGMLREANRRYGADLSTSVFIGDHWTDLGAARAAGCPFVLVLSGRVNRAEADQSSVRPDSVVDDLFDAARYVVSGSGEPARWLADLKAVGR